MSDDSINIFRTRLIQVREERGLSQINLARLAGLTQSTVSQLESGARKPNFESLRKLADVLGVSTDFLLGRVDDDTQTHAELLYRGALQLSSSDVQLVREFVDLLRRRKGSDAS